MSLVICFLENIKQELDKLTELVSTNTGKNVLKRIKTELMSRFAIGNVHVASSLLDPALKNIDWMKRYLGKDENGETLETEADVLKYFIKLFEIDMGGAKTLEKSSVDNMMDPFKNCRLKVFSNIGIKLNVEENSRSDSVTEEIENYLKEPLENIPSSTTEWWESKKNKFPRLAELFNIFLSIPPTSTTSEVAFSKSGKFLRADRAMLAPNKVKMMCFINANVRFLEASEEIFVIDM